MSRTAFVAGNWKMNHTVPSAIQFIEVLLENLETPACDILIAPSFTALWALQKKLVGTPVVLGGQNLFFEPKGAFTGEISAEMLKDCGCRFVILGHSERRHQFDEDDELINNKIKTAVKEELEVIFCVGETRQAREEGITEQIIQRQLEIGLAGIESEAFSNIILAYEPVWAIGTGLNATPEQAQSVHCFIREWIASRYDSTISEAVRILYGGSVKASNAGDLVAKDDIDGLLVGSASLDAKSFCAIISSIK